MSSAQNAVSANVTEGIIDRLRNYFLRYPRSKPKYACMALHLDPKRYGATARVVKSRVKRMWGGANVEADTLEALTTAHRQVWYLQGGVPAGPVLSAFLDIARNGMNRDDTWYVSGNRNGQLNYRSQKLAVRVLPSTRRLEVLLRKPGVTGKEMREEFHGILLSTFNGRLPTDHDASHVAGHLSRNLVPVERHRRFEFPPGPYYKLRFHEDTLGLVIQHDLSEKVNELEVIEKIPPWIRDVIHCIERLAEHQRDLAKNMEDVKGFLLRTQESNVSDNAKNITR